jgi:hypothetical protein
MDNDQLEHRVKILTFISIVLFFLFFVCLFSVLFIFGKSSKLPANTSGNNQVSAQEDKLAIKELTADEKKKIADEVNSFCQQKLEKDNICKGADCLKASEFTDCSIAYLSEKAQTDRNLSLCSFISEGWQKTDCMDNVYISIAFNENNLVACGKLSADDQKTSCANQINYNLAIANKSKEYCQPIKNDKLKAKCNNDASK